MDDLTVLVTGAGAPGIKGTVYSLKQNFDDRPVKVIGTDIKADVIGKYICDEFFQISKPTTESYLDELLSICDKQKVDVLLPQNTAELSILAQNKNKFKQYGTTIAISDEKSINIANNKHMLLKAAQKIGVPTPVFLIVDNFEDLLLAAKELGWPHKPIVVKPPCSNGMRGVRIINEYIDLKSMFYSEKPNGLYLKMNYLETILGHSFPQLLVMEYLPNEEYTIDLLKSDDIIVIPRKRDTLVSGITFSGTIENHEELIDYSTRLANEIGLEYAFGFQFKLDEHGVPKLLESNPRIQGTMVLSTFADANIIYGAVKQALGEEIPKFNPKWNSRIIRYWGGIGIYNNKITGSL